MNDSETVVLSFPRKAPYFAVARLVVGGLAAPLEMSYDALDDLQLAISSLLDNEDLPAADQLTLKLHVGDGSMRASLGRFPAESVEVAFRRSSDKEGELDLRKLLDTIVDGVEVAPDGDGHEWVTLTKKVKAEAVT